MVNIYLLSGVAYILKGYCNLDMIMVMKVESVKNYWQLPFFIQMCRIEAAVSGFRMQMNYIED